MRKHPIVRRSARAIFAIVVASSVVSTSAFAGSSPPKPAAKKAAASAAPAARNTTDSPRVSESAARQLTLLKKRKQERLATQPKVQDRLLLARDVYYGTIEPELKSLRTTVETVKGKPDTPIVEIGFDRVNFMAVLKALDDIPSVEVIVSLPDGIRVAVPFHNLEAVAAIPQVRWVRQADGWASSRRTSGGGPVGPVAAPPTGRSDSAARAANVRAALAPVLAARLAQKGAGTEAVNVSEGDISHRALDGRNFFGATGAGVTIGVLSDGVNSLATSQASGDLGPVTVLPGQAGSGNEGVAMLEIVHDLAPNANLMFATALPSQAQFAANITALRAAGCDIIVDDIIYFDESPFRDGGGVTNTLIATAVQGVIASGGMYFSSAGNEGNLNDNTSGVWEGMFVPSTAADPAALAGANLHAFSGNPATTNSNQVAATSVETILNWNNPIGTASDDYDFYIMNSTLTTIFDASVDVQDGIGGNDFPVERTDLAFTGERILVDLFSGSAQFLRFQNFRGRLTMNTAGATYGHSTVDGAFGTAAVDVGSSPGVPFVGGATNPVETFSADGPRRYFTQADGTPFPGGFIDRQKPDIAAADGVATSAPGFNPFFGTSAAAPHAAALAALLLSADPSFTPAQIRTFLTSTALDIEAVGVDRDSGAGIVMGFQSLQGAGVEPVPNLDVDSTTFFEVTGNGSGFFDPCERIGVTVTLENVGGATATGITGTLTSNTAGVQVISGTSPYPDIPAAGTASNTGPLTVLIDDAVACGTIVNLTLTVDYGPGMLQEMFPLSFVVGRPGMPVTFSYTGPAVPIPDGTGLTGTIPGAPAVANLPVMGLTGNVFDIDFRIDGATCNTTVGSTTVGIDHSFVNDLELTVISPSGTEVLVVNNTDGSGNNFCQTLLDDESAGPSIQSVVTANNPFTGTFTPNAALSAFDGEGGNGTWMLRAQDFFGIDTGNIRAFSLIITPAVCDPVPLDIACPNPITVSNDTGLCTAVVNYDIPLSANACATVTCSPNTGSMFPVGTTTVTCTAQIAAEGDPTAMCTFTVTVNDTEPPSVTCPSPITQPNDMDMCGAVVNYTVPTPTDNCSATVMCSPDTGTFFNVGTTTVTCTATDPTGNTATCSFTVTVNDTQLPTITCPMSITTVGDTVDTGTCAISSGALTFPAPAVSDNCPGVGAPVCTPASGSSFPVGVTTVTCTVMDAGGNTNSCSFTVTVTSPFTPGMCFVDDARGDIFQIVTMTGNPLRGFWTYFEVATGNTYCGFAESLAFLENRSLTAYDRDNPLYNMKAIASWSTRTATVELLLKQALPQRTIVLRDRNITNNICTLPAGR